MPQRHNKPRQARRRAWADWLTYVMSLFGVVSIVGWNTVRHLPQINRTWGLFLVCAPVAWLWMALIGWLRGDKKTGRATGAHGNVMGFWVGLGAWRWHRTWGLLPWPGCQAHCLHCCRCKGCRTERGRALVHAGVAFPGPL